jgi:hypothetical protein
MTIQFGLTDGPVNTQYAPLAALSAHYQQNRTLGPLHGVQIPMRKRDFTPSDKLVQVLLSVLAGCVTLSEVNLKLKSELGLAQIWHWDQFTDQSNLSRTLDALTLKNIDQLRAAVLLIWHPLSAALRHDWRSYLWLDFDLSGLPCGKQAQESQKGHFSGEKTQLDASWHVSVPSSIEKRSGQTCIQGTSTQYVAYNRLCLVPKML